MKYLPLAVSFEDEPFHRDLAAFPCVQEHRGEMAALHLPVAPLCNIQCTHCDRSGDCVRHSPHGSTSLLLTANQAYSYAMDAIRREPRIKCIGVSGPGDPLASAETTFGTLRQIRNELPNIPFFWRPTACNFQATWKVCVNLAFLFVQCPSILSTGGHWHARLIGFRGPTAY